MRLRKQLHQLVLAAVRVLVFVHHDVTQAAVPGFARGLVVLEQSHRFEQKVVEIERIGGAQRLFILLVKSGYLFRLGVHGLLVEIRGGEAQVLGVADARHRRAVLHELFLFETESPVGGLDDGELIVVVVDVEAAGESRTDSRQRVAVSPKQPHAEGVKSGQPG